MVEDRSDPFQPGIGFDPVCGSTVRGGDSNAFFDGDTIHYFCSVECRRVFLEARRSRTLPRPRGDERIPPDSVLSI